MIKLVSLLRRAEHLSPEVFQCWWLEEHTQLAKKLPGLRRYVVGLTEGGLGNDAEWDGMAELWFDDEASLHAAFETAPGKAAFEDTLAHTSRRHRFITREHPVVG